MNVSVTPMFTSGCMKGTLHLSWFKTGKTQVYLLFPLSVRIPTLSVDQLPSQSLQKCLQSKHRATAALVRKDKASGVDKKSSSRWGLQGRTRAHSNANQIIELAEGYL